MKNNPLSHQLEKSDWKNSMPNAPLFYHKDYLSCRHCSFQVRESVSSLYYFYKSSLNYWLVVSHPYWNAITLRETLGFRLGSVLRVHLITQWGFFIASTPSNVIQGLPRCLKSHPRDPWFSVILPSVCQKKSSPLLKF